VLLRPETFFHAISYRKLESVLKSDFALTGGAGHIPSNASKKIVMSALRLWTVKLGFSSIF
jgi:hypothetical protein